MPKLVASSASATKPARKSSSTNCSTPHLTWTLMAPRGPQHLGVTVVPEVVAVAPLTAPKNSAGSSHKSKRASLWWPELRAASPRGQGGVVHARTPMLTGLWRRLGEAAGATSGRDEASRWAEGMSMLWMICYWEGLRASWSLLMRRPIIFIEGIGFN